jgi:hypothetical protein
VVGDVGDGGKGLRRHLKTIVFFFNFFIGSILCCSESGDDDDTQENFSQIWLYNLNTKLENLK